ncbi:hypothetical protein vBKpnAMK6_00230 [Klebsiella phage vB_Kpn_AM_K6]|nr:hypothetical protein SHINKOU_79 [Klebsiella phage vB_KaeM_Shinkou]WFG79100.1 hypothetical protein VIPKPNUMC01_00093 [Klebsiella phage vB_VIPKPNUMC01]
MSLAAIKDIECWLNNIKVYPPGHIFAGKPKGKAEKSCEAICEKLYKFNFGDKKNVLAEVHSSYHELRVMVNVFRAPPFIELRKEYANKVFDTFLANVQDAVKHLDEMHKQHQDLNAYYKPWRKSYQELKNRIELIRYEVLK